MIKHAKINTAPDDGIPGNVQGADWNAHHVIANIGLWTAHATTIDAVGIDAPTVTGSAASRGAVSTSYATGIKRIGLVSAGSAGSIGGARATVARYWRGNAANAGGFHMVFRFMIGDASIVTTGRTFVGVWSSTGAPTDVDPSTLTNLIGVGTNANDTVLQLYAAGSAAQARVSLGANFPADATNSDVYELVLSCAANASGVTYKLTRLNTGHVATGTITAAAQLPSATTFLTQQMWRTNGVTAAAVALDLIGFYAETDL